MSSLSLARNRASRGRTIAFALLAVPAIVIGLLAMHVMNGGLGAAHATASHPSTVGQIASHSGHHPGLTQSLGAATVESLSVSMAPGETAPNNDCGGLCAGGHEMLGMLCVLALLVAAMFFARTRAINGWQRRLHHVAALVASPASLASPPPPSLHVLSISRT